MKEMRDENIVALCDVNENNLNAAAQRAPGAKTFRDFRKLYDDLKDSDFDAVVVATTEHTHAFATLPALHRKKHVYCEKPLTRDVYEARLITEAAAAAGVATQMGTQIHATDNYRRVVELIQDGLIGPVREAHVWVSRAWGWQTPEEAAANKDIVSTQDRPDRRNGRAAGTRLGPLDRSGADAALQQRLFSRPEVVPLVGFRQWDDERSRLALQRPPLLGTEPGRPADHRSERAAAASGDRPGLDERHV